MKNTSQVVNKNYSQLYSIYANPEHVHFLISKSPKISEERIASTIAESSQKFINENKLCACEFAWQQTAAAFSVSKKDVDSVCKYILNQPEHHRRVSFQKGYEKLMKSYQTALQPFEKLSIK